MNTEVWLPFVILALLMIARLPIAFAVGIAGTVGVILSLGPSSALSLLGSVPYSGSVTYSLTTIPLFVLMAEFLTKGSLSHALFDVGRKWFGSIRGGMAMGTVAGGAAFGAMAGSSVAGAGLLSSTAVPEMRRLGYHDSLAVGTSAIAGTLAIVIPPSTAMIIYGVATDTSIGALFAAGVLPGILTALAYMAVIAIWARVKPGDAPRGERVRFTEKFKSLWSILPVIPLIVLVFGGLYAGIMTPTESGAIGAAGALILSVTLGGLRWRGILDAFKGALLVSAMIMLIVATSHVFGVWLATSGTSTLIAEGILGLGGGSKWPVLAMIMVLYLILGTFMDQMPILLLTLPITFPIVMGLGLDPVWFGLIVIKTVEIGLITPPMGLNVLVANGVAGGNLKHVFKGALILGAADVVLIVLYLIFPEIILAPVDLIFNG